LPRPDGNNLAIVNGMVVSVIDPSVNIRSEIAAMPLILMKGQENLLSDLKKENDCSETLTVIVAALLLSWSSLYGPADGEAKQPWRTRHNPR